MASEARKQAGLPQDLPLVVSTRDLVRWSGLDRRRLARHLAAKGVLARPGRGSGGNTYDTEELQREWPEFVQAIRMRMARDLPDYSFFREPR